MFGLPSFPTFVAASTCEAEVEAANTVSYFDVVDVKKEIHCFSYGNFAWFVNYFF